MLPLDNIYLASFLFVLALIFLAKSGYLFKPKEKYPSLPYALKGAKLFMNEQYLEIENPKYLNGIPDQVWQLPNGMLVPIDTKTRKSMKTNEYDRIQLTGYAYLLKHHPDTKHLPIAPYGYIRFPMQLGDQYRKVQLLKKNAYEECVDRYTLLSAGKIQPRKPQNTKFCVGCGHQDTCNYFLFNVKKVGNR